MSRTRTFALTGACKVRRIAAKERKEHKKNNALGAAGRSEFSGVRPNVTRVLKDAQFPLSLFYDKMAPRMTMIPDLP